MNLSYLDALLCSKSMSEVTGQSSDFGYQNFYNEEALEMRVINLKHTALFCLCCLRSSC